MSLFMLKYDARLCLVNIRTYYLRKGRYVDFQLVYGAVEKNCSHRPLSEPSSAHSESLLKVLSARINRPKRLSGRLLADTHQILIRRSETHLHSCWSARLQLTSWFCTVPADWSCWRGNILSFHECNITDAISERRWGRNAQSVKLHGSFKCPTKQHYMTKQKQRRNCYCLWQLEEK